MERKKNLFADVEKPIKSLFKGMIKQVASQSRYLSYISNPIATKTKPKMTQISFTLTSFGWSIFRYTLGNHCVLRSPFVKRIAFPKDR